MFPPSGSGYANTSLNIPAATTGTLTVTLAVVGPPTASVTKVSPASRPVTGGTKVTITGTGFTGATALHFGVNPATSYTVNSATSVTATAPALSEPYRDFAGPARHAGSGKPVWAGQRTSEVPVSGPFRVEDFWRIDLRATDLNGPERQPTTPGMSR